MAYCLLYSNNFPINICTEKHNFCRTIFAMKFKTLLNLQNMLPLKAVHSILSVLKGHLNNYFLKGR